MSDLISINRIIGQSLYTKGAAVPKYSYPGKVSGSIAGNTLIGVVYSYLIAADGLYWMFNDAFNNPYYVKQSTALDLPGKAAILAEAAAAADRKAREDKGIIQYNIDKYGKWIVGGVVVAVALPTILQAINQYKNKKSLSGVKDGGGLILLLFLGGMVYAYGKKRKGSIIDLTLDEGEFVNEVQPTFFDATQLPTGMGRVSVPLTL